MPDRQIARLLEENFTLPLGLAAGVETLEARQSLVAAEVTKLTDLLVSQGYLEARVETQGGLHGKTALRLRPFPGPLYRIGTVRIEGLPDGASAELRAAVAGLLAQQTAVEARRSVVDALGRSILLELREASYASAALRAVDFVPDPQTGRADLVLSVEAGAPMRFGEIAFSGSLRMREDALQALVPFTPGSAYSLGAVDALRNALDLTGTFSRIRVEVEPSPDMPGVVNLSVQLKDKGAPLEAGVQPRILFATLLVLAGLHMVRLTSLWAETALRRFLILSAVVFVCASAVEVGNRLYLFLYY